MASHPRPEQKDMQGTYIQARLEGEPARQAARAAGYSDSTKISDIERVGGPVQRRMMEILERAGLSDEMLAQEYKDGVAGAKKDHDWMAFAKLLLQLGYLRGHGRHAPQVAVQINNGRMGPAGEVDDPGRAEEILRRIEGVLEVLEDEVGARESAGVHADGAAPDDAEARPGVDQPSPEPEETPGGGQP